jgi:TolB-like protein
MTDELIGELGTIHGLRVISRTSVMLYKHARVSAGAKIPIVPVEKSPPLD